MTHEQDNSLNQRFYFVKKDPQMNRTLSAKSISDRKSLIRMTTKMLCRVATRKCVVISFLIMGMIMISASWRLSLLTRIVSANRSKLNQENVVRFTTTAESDHIFRHELRKIVQVVKAPELMKDVDEIKPLTTYVLEPVYILAGADKEKFRWSAINMVKSAVPNKDRRIAIRDTWGVEIKNGIRIKTVFIVGTVENQTKQEEIVKEYDKYGDILQINIPDDYKHVPDKVVAGMQWVSDVFPGDWLYSSADDDIVLHVHNFIRYIDNTILHGSNDVSSYTSTEDLPILCVYSYNSKDIPARNEKSKWFMPKKIYPPRKWPPYCRGGWYTSPVSTAKKLYFVSRRSRSLYLDDVWITGLMRIKMLFMFTDLPQNQLIEHGIIPAPLSLRNDIQLQKGEGEEDLEKVLVSHVWGNIEGNKIDVPETIRNIWNVWSVEQTKPNPNRTQISEKPT